MNDIKHISLSNLQSLVKNQIENAFPESLWIIAEIHQLSVNRSGHCYIDLIEKGEGDQKIIAKASGIIWAYTYRLLKPYFETTTKQEFTHGLKVLLNVKPEFNEIYGFSLIIKDIDPNYTIGDLAVKRQNIINQLHNEGIFVMNKDLTEPLFYKKIAIISSPTAAGYEDFVNQIENNPYQYKVQHHLFSAIMQGNDAESSIVLALDKVYALQHLYDAVVIIRGGGSKTDLLCFDSYLLASNVAQFPIPVITGIGHERDESIVDLVAHIQLKTPTAVAEYLISKMLYAETELNTIKDTFISAVNQYFSDKKNEFEIYPAKLSHLTKQFILLNNQRLATLSLNFSSSVKAFMLQKTNQLDFLTLQLNNETRNAISLQKRKVDDLAQKFPRVMKDYFKNHNQYLDNQLYKIQHLKPSNILKRGYSITLHNGKPLKSNVDIKTGDVIVTQLYEGEFISEVKSSQQQAARD